MARQAGQYEAGGAEAPGGRRFTMKTDRTPTEVSQAKELIVRWFESRPLETKSASCLLLALTDGDHGDADTALDILTRYGTDLLDAAQGDGGAIHDEPKVMLGAWLATETLTGC
jgi:hypothetical protein